MLFYILCNKKKKKWNVFYHDKIKKQKTHQHTWIKTFPYSNGWIDALTPNLKPKRIHSFTCVWSSGCNAEFESIIMNIIYNFFIYKCDKINIYFLLYDFYFSLPRTFFYRQKNWKKYKSVKKCKLSIFFFLDRNSKTKPEIIDSKKLFCCSLSAVHIYFDIFQYKNN